MLVRLVRQYDKGLEIKRDKQSPLDSVEIDLDRKSGEAFAIIGDRIAFKIVRARVDSISKSGLLISGLEENNSNGKRGFWYQEWWCVTTMELA